MSHRHKQHHYTGCGLDWVYLMNGYATHETPHGKGVSIENAEDLHDLIAREIITGPQSIRGQELRFLRSMIDVSQEGLGRIIGLSRAQIARYEGKRDKPVTPAADRALRMFYALYLRKNEITERILEVLNEIDERKHERTKFTETDFGWARAA